jgi:signal peptidase I
MTGNLSYAYNTLRRERTPCGTHNLRATLLTAAASVMLGVFTAGCSDNVHYVMSSTSMSPTINKKDEVTVDTGAYSSHGPRRWDIVLLKLRTSNGTPFKTTFRVIGLPNEKISYKDAGGLLINGQVPSKPRHLRPINYRLTPSSSIPRQWLTRHPVLLSQDEYYLLGDNVAKAKDSRFRGPIPRKRIIGKVISHK